MEGHVLSAVAVLKIYPQHGAHGALGNHHGAEVSRNIAAEWNRRNRTTMLLHNDLPTFPYPFCSRSQHFTTSGSKRIRWRNLIVGMPA